MQLFKRLDGTLVTDEKPLRNLMPFLMPTRNEAVVYFEQSIPVGSALAYLQKNPELTLFHLLLTGMIRSLATWPRMNRFIAGGRIYQRHKPVISFAVKKRLDENAGMTAVKVEFEPDDNVFKVAERVNERIHQGRGKKLTTSEKEMRFVTKLPGFLLRFLFCAQRFLDGLNLLPYSMIKNDPMYASIFAANLGSIGLKAPWHHLSEYGTTPLFGVIGKVQKVPFVTESDTVSVREEVLIRWSFDERITDGLYCAKALALFEQNIMNPKNLEN
ncbi:MAG: hypothetical protein V4534_09160 [Myxococcota bacterium]